MDIEKLDALMNQVSELIIAKNSLVSISSTEEGGFTNQGFHEQIEYLERITTSLHESVMKVRMVPIESVVNKFPRMIRDLSRTLNKKMELVMTGEDTELDRTVVDQIGDPLQHLLRNSADHGLEDTELRIQRGKPEVGNIFLNAYQEGNNVIIQVGDDGNGIDTEAVKAKAIERNIITPEQAEVMTQKEIINLLFMPSFSMAKKITDISGRGVGLDVVLRAFLGQRVDQADQTQLGRAVVRLAEVAEQTAGRGGDDNTAEALLAEVRPRGADDVVPAVQVHLEHDVPLLGGHLVEGAVTQDARVGHHTVDLAERVVEVVHLDLVRLDPLRKLVICCRLHALSPKF